MESWQQRNIDQDTDNADTAQHGIELANKIKDARTATRINVGTKAKTENAVKATETVHERIGATRRTVITTQSPPNNCTTNTLAIHNH